MRNPAALLPLLLALAACATGLARTAPQNSARLGRAVPVGGITVRPDRVVEDSRCPRDVRCVWAGRVIVSAIVSGGGWSRRVDLTLGEPVPIADGTLTLQSVTPERGSARPIPLRNYRFQFDFQGGL